MTSYLGSQCKKQISQTIGIQFYTLAVCLVSILSTLFVFSAFIIYRREARRYVKKFKNTNLRMRTLIYMNVFGLIYSTLLFVQSVLVSTAGSEIYTRTWWFYKYPYCQIQAAIGNWSSLSLNAWNVCCTLHLFFQLTGGWSFASLRTLYRRFERFFIVLTFVLIPIPFIIMIFKLPLAGTDRWVLLYGKPQEKHWCDFANMPDRRTSGNVSTSQAPIETRWAVFWEIGFFYVPNVLMLLTSMVMYVVIVYKIRVNSRQLKSRATQLAKQTGDLYNQRILDKELSSEINEDAQPVVNRSETNETVTVDVGPIHAPLALTDYDQYMRFLQLQARTASYYIVCLGVNWVVWIAARLLWQFADCSIDSYVSYNILKVIFIILECSGPRIDCILLSVVYGLAENTATPNNFEDLVSNSLVVPILKDYCTKHWHVEYRGRQRNKSKEIISAVSHMISTSNRGEYTQLSNHNPVIHYNKSSLSCEDILYFWYDVQRLKDYRHNHSIFVKKFLQLATMPKLNADVQSAQTLQKIDTLSDKIFSLTKEIYDQFLTTQSPLTLHEFMSNSNFAKFEHVVNEYANRRSKENVDCDEEPLTYLYSQPDEYVAMKVRDYETEFTITSQYVNYALKLLVSAEKIAEEYLQNKTQALLSSNRVDEIQMVLRVKSKGSTRSIYRDVVERVYLKLKDTAQCVKKCTVLKLSSRKKKRMTNFDSDSSDSDSDDEVQASAAGGGERLPRLIDPAIYVYVRLEKKSKLLKLTTPLEKLSDRNTIEETSDRADK